MRKIISLFLFLLFIYTPSFAQVPFPGWGVVKAVPAASCTTAGFTCNAATTQNCFFNQDANNWRSIMFTADASYTVCKAIVRMHRDDQTFTSTLQAFIYTDASNYPGTQVGTGSDTLLSSSLGLTEGDVSFVNMSAAITSGTKYHLVIHRSVSDSTYKVYWDAAADGGCSTVDKQNMSSNGTAWSYDSWHSQKFILYK